MSQWGLTNDELWRQVNDAWQVRTTVNRQIEITTFELMTEGIGSDFSPAAAREFGKALIAAADEIEGADHEPK